MYLCSIKSKIQRVLYFSSVIFYFIKVGKQSKTKVAIKLFLLKIVEITWAAQ